MFAFIIILTTMIFLACAFGAFCLCKESINWRSEQMGYDLEESLKSLKRMQVCRKWNIQAARHKNNAIGYHIRWRYFYAINRTCEIIL